KSESLESQSTEIRDAAGNRNCASGKSTRVARSFSCSPTQLARGFGPALGDPCVGRSHGGRLVDCVRLSEVTRWQCEQGVVFARRISNSTGGNVQVSSTGLSSAAFSRTGERKAI